MQAWFQTFLSDESRGWVGAYALARGVGPSTIIESAVRSFRADCEAGVPELVEVSDGQG